MTVADFQGTLSRQVPARTQVQHFTWITKFQVMSQQFRDIRNKMREGSMQSCFWCRHSFEDGEQTYLAARPKARNVLLCSTCADQAQTKGGTT